MKFGRRENPDMSDSAGSTDTCDPDCVYCSGPETD